jgi:hypothetical protein
MAQPGELVVQLIGYLGVNGAGLDLRKLPLDAGREAWSLVTTLIVA